ncbi:MAG: hypothetical protein GQ570_10370 [Helicobacteraceae bacterium]|nr:hypothetical protein [Helicobacteraceae bacterium]
MIKTRYPIALEIDDQPFSIVVNEPTKAQQKKIGDIFDKSALEHSKRDSLQSELNETQNEFDINKQILSEDDVNDRHSILLEQKAHNKRIPQILKDITELDKTLTNMSETLNEAFAKRFDLLVSGNDKAALKKEIETKNINYQVLFNAISELVKKEKVKK